MAGGGWGVGWWQSVFALCFIWKIRVGRVASLNNRPGVFSCTHTHTHTHRGTHRHTHTHTHTYTDRHTQTHIRLIYKSDQPETDNQMIFQSARIKHHYLPPKCFVSLFRRQAFSESSNYHLTSREEDIIFHFAS